MWDWWQRRGGSRETARATAKPQIEFSRLGDNPHSYLKTYLSLKQKKISFVWNCFGSSRYFWDYIFGPGGARSLSFPLFHVSGNDVIVFFVFWNPIKGDQDNTYLTQWEKEGCYRKLTLRFIQGSDKTIHSPYILKVNKLTESSFQAKKSWRKKCINDYDKCSRQIYANYKNASNFGVK